MIWAVGVEVPHLKDWLPVETDRTGRVAVRTDLSLPGHPNVFVIGDAASAPWRDGLMAVLSRKQRATPARMPIFDGETQARLTALACSAPPEGRARWTLRLLEDKVVELGIAGRVSDNTIGCTAARNCRNGTPITASAAFCRSTSMTPRPAAG